MDNIGNNNQCIKCPYCPSLFLNQADLQTHIKRFGNNPAQHLDEYKKTHGRIEHGYGGDE
jgi:hypothetical protein